MGYIADFSHNQKSVDWSKLAGLLDFAILRVQFGSLLADKKYKEFVAGCKKYGIPFGTYAYGQFVSVNDAIKEADDAFARMDKDSKFFAVDVEEVTTYKPSDLVPATQAFINRMKSHGIQKVGLYTGHSFYKDHKMGRVKADFLWIPRYAIPDKGVIHSNKPDSKIPADIWQYSQKGKLPGIYGYIDLDTLTGRKPIEWFIGKVKKPTPNHTPKPSPANTSTINGIKVVGHIQIVNVKYAAYIVEKPSSSSRNLGEAKKGTKLPISGSVPGWYEVIYKGKRAYVKDDYAKRV